MRIALAFSFFVFGVLTERHCEERSNSLLAEQLCRLGIATLSLAMTGGDVIITASRLHYP